MDPETIEDDRSDDLIQRTSTQAITVQLKRFGQLEEEAILELQQIQEAQNATLERLASIQRERNYWIGLLEWEGDRLIRQSNADWDAAQERDEDEKYRNEETIKIVEKHRADLFNRLHLVGYFVRISTCGKQRKGIVTERHSQRNYTVLLLDGSLEYITSHQFKAIQPTEIEQQTLRNLGYDGPFGNHGQFSLT